MRILYVSYDGILEPLGRSQVLEYVKILARRHSITLITYEKPSDWELVERRHQIEAEAQEAGVDWVPLRYHRNPRLPATVYDILAGIAVGARKMRDADIELIHARSYVPATIAAALKLIFGVKFVFDMRGFWVDERVEAGSWSEDSALYLWAKWFEKRLLIAADGIVSLTRGGAAAVRGLPFLAGENPRIEVIPTATNLEQFKPQPRLDGTEFIVGCVGSMGLRYHMLDETLECFKSIRKKRPGARLLILSRDSHAHIRERLDHAGVPPEVVEMESVLPEDIPARMGRISLGLFLVRPGNSTVARYPTKLGEFLASGIPCLTNGGIGDYGDLLEREKAGIVLTDLSEDGRLAAAARALELLEDSETPARCREAARKHLSLDSAVEVLDRFYGAVRSDFRRGSRILYVSYDGIMEPLGRSQVFEYLRGLSRDHAITLVSYEKGHDLGDGAKLRRLRDEVAACGIRWRALRYHARPTLLATGYDVALGLLVCGSICLTNDIRIVHARSYVPALIGWILKHSLGVRFLFDMRGLWADEKVDGGLWPKGSSLYWLVKRLERRFLSDADAIVSLSRAGADIIKEFPYLRGRGLRLEVIPTATNLDRFRPGQRAEKKDFVVGCVGSVGLWYMFDEMLDCFNHIRRLKPDARLIVLNRDAHQFIRERIERAGIPAERTEVKAVDATSVAGEMVKMDAGLFLIRPVFSKKACCPTKLGEFLACGVPCFSNAGVGDYGEILSANGVGAVLEAFTPEAKEAAARRIVELASDERTRKRCVETAHRLFSLEAATAAYDRLYGSLSAA